MSKIQDNLIKKGKEIFLTYGDNIDRDEYLAIDIPDKPSKHYINKYFGNFITFKTLCLNSLSPPENKYLIKQNERLLKELEKQRNINQVFIDNCLGTISKCTFIPAKVPRKERVKQDQEFHALNSDTHCGEVVDPEWVQGIAEYNSELFIGRMNLWAEKICLFRDQDKNSLGLNKLVMYMLGDHMEGELIYKGQAYNIDLITMDQFMLAFQTYVDIILFFASVFPKIEIFCVLGNHGRLGRKGEAHPKSNFDYLLYRMLNHTLKKQNNVKIYVSKSPTMIVRNGNYNFSLNHNDDVRSYLGIPYYGLDRKARRLNNLYNMIINYMLGGHFHTSANLHDNIILNGSMVGGSDLSVNKMNTAELPSQKIFYFDGNHGIHRVSDIKLAEPVKLTPDENGIYTAYTV